MAVMADLVQEKMSDLDNDKQGNSIWLQDDPWSWKDLEFRKTIFQAWKVMENSKGHGKSRKTREISILSWILWNFYNCTEKFCNVILLTVVTVVLSS